MHIDRSIATTAIQIHESFWEDIQEIIDELEANDCVELYHEGQMNLPPQATRLAMMSDEIAEHWNRACRHRDQELAVFEGAKRFRLEKRLMVRAAEFMHDKLLGALEDVERRSFEIRGGGYDDVTDDEIDKSESITEERAESPDVKHHKDIFARHTRDAKASNIYLIHALTKLQESLAGYEGLRACNGGKTPFALLIESTPVPFSVNGPNARTGERAIQSYGHIILEDAKNVKMTSTEVRCVRQATRPGPIPEPGKLETAADEVVATWEQAMALSNKEVVLPWNSMKKQIETVMAASAEFSHFWLQSSGASKAVEENAGERIEDNNSSFSDVPRPRGGGGDDNSEPESSNAGTKPSSLQWTPSNYMTIVRLGDALKTSQRTLEIYEGFKARAGGEFAKLLLDPSSPFCNPAMVAQDRLVPLCMFED